MQGGFLEPIAPLSLPYRALLTSKVLIPRGGVLMSMGNFPESFPGIFLSRDNLSMEIGRKSHLAVSEHGHLSGKRLGTC